MIYDYCIDPNYISEPQPVTYEITNPVLLKLRNSDGREELIGYGIGEKIKILETTSICLVPHTPKLRKEIQMLDGRVIIEFPEMNFTRRVNSVP